MSRDPRYDILFEPIKIGPLTARNRFYQVPHCTGAGRNHPNTAAGIRAVTAEGGWAVVSTEQCDIHYTADMRSQTRIWSSDDIPMHARMVDRVHEHGALAACELVHNGSYSPNHLYREVPLSPSVTPVHGPYPVHARAMDKQDIRNFRAWHRRAARLALEAGFDIVYVYAGHDITLLLEFISKRYNRRSDEYGGSLENRARLFRECMEDVHEEIAGRGALAVRLCVDELLGDGGITAGNEGRELIEMLGELPDLWDVNVSDWDNDSMTARFAAEGYQERYTAFVKSVTTRPVVGVGRFTSPDTMVDQIRRGVLDFIGAARPAIADPFLPAKIEQGRIEDIRECIGCNICVASNNTQNPMRCTQNPTRGEEWRRGWHPETFAPGARGGRVLIVGAGPAGLEAARALGEQGYEVLLTDRRREPGGRVSRESRLPGLATWARVRDWRLGQIEKLSNVSFYPESDMTAQSVLETECKIVAIATGAIWRRDGLGRSQRSGVTIHPNAVIYTPDDLMEGVLPQGPVVIFDDDHYYMGGVLAERLQEAGIDVTLVTPESRASAYTEYTLEQHRIQARLIELGVQIIPLHTLTAVSDDSVEIACVFTARTRQLECASTILVTALSPVDKLYDRLVAEVGEAGQPSSVHIARIGDCYGPGTIAAAVWSGHRFARDPFNVIGDSPPFLVERATLASDPSAAPAQMAQLRGPGPRA